MRFTVAKKGVLPLLALSFISPFDRVAGAKCVEGNGIVKTLSLSLSIERARPRLRLEGGSMKNDDAALVKEMKSGLVPREREGGRPRVGKPNDQPRECIAYVRGA